MRGIGNLCVGADTDPDYDARRLVAVLFADAVGFSRQTRADADETYRRRRDRIASIAMGHETGEPIPPIDYTEVEEATVAERVREDAPPVPGEDRSGLEDHQ